MYDFTHQSEGGPRLRCQHKGWGYQNAHEGSLLPPSRAEELDQSKSMCDRLVNSTHLFLTPGYVWDIIQKRKNNKLASEKMPVTFQLYLNFNLWFNAKSKGNHKFRVWLHWTNTAALAEERWERPTKASQKEGKKGRNQVDPRARASTVYRVPQ